jgi:hypothetical protein
MWIGHLARSPKGVNKMENQLGVDNGVFSALSFCTRELEHAATITTPFQCDTPVARRPTRRLAVVCFPLFRATKPSPSSPQPNPRYDPSEIEEVIMACHCTGCQSMSSSAYSLSVAIPSDGFEVTRGEPVIGGLHGSMSHHYFCPHCMTWMFTRTEGMEFFVNLRPTMLDDASWFTPFIETWTREKLPFAETGARHSYEALPDMAAYEGLIKEYMGSQA